MKTIVRNPRDGIYPVTEDYVHAIEVVAPQRFLYVSGTMGLDADGAAAKGLDAQLAAVWRNLKRILAQADMTVDNVVRVTSYLRDRAGAEKNAKARVAALGGRLVPTTAIVVETLEADWLVEIEIVAAA